MSRMTVTLVSALGMALAGCASDPYASGMRYQDGGYYSPASDGRGDYYIAPDYRDGYSSFGDPFYDPFVFGPSWYGGGYGYCSVRYRYCPSGWLGAYGYGRPGFGTSLWLGFGRSGFYDPWGYSDAWAFYDPWAFHDPWIFYARSRDQTRRHHRPDPRDEVGQQRPQIPRDPSDPDAVMADRAGGWATYRDGDGDGRPDTPALERRRMLRPQPAGQPELLDAQQQPLPWFEAQVREPVDRGGPVQRPRQSRWAGEADGARRGGYGGAPSSGGARSSSPSQRSDSGPRPATSDDSGQTSRGRRRARDD